MNTVLDHLAIDQKINRLAHELIEHSFEEKTIFLGGISGNGLLLAEQLKSIIQANSEQVVVVFEISINKEEPWAHPITLTIEQATLKHGYIVLVDDVLNSGKTMQYALLKFLEHPTKAIKTTVLVDRSHRNFPIKADFVGLSLSTTVKDRVEVDLSDTDKRAYLV